MKRNLFSAILLLALCFLLSGCSSTETALPEAAASDYSVENLSVEYDLEDGSHKVIRVRFESSEITVKYFLSDDVTEQSEEYSNSDELSEFLCEKVIPSITLSDSEGSSSEEKIVWVVRISTEDDTIIDEGFEGDAYPAYWQELLEFLE